MKKKILAIALCAVLLIIAIAGASLAYLGDCVFELWVRERLINEFIAKQAQNQK